ncbi:MAG TPA: hypothetical protein VFH97_07060 [Gemmatimonadales bacterium]|nr:hypothetical protein [Gemmatimonadales bacterium]
MPQSNVLERLRQPGPLVAVELRPPPAGLAAGDAMDLWIDMAHEVRRLARHDTVLFLTDNAVGAAEEENLRHLATNLADEISPARAVPFLTSKHALDYCVLYAARAASHGYQALTVLGGDQRVGAPRCVPHASELRQVLRQRVPGLALGGWANPHRDPSRQVDFLLDRGYSAEFYLTQIVSHHEIRAVEAFVREAARRGVAMPGVFGVFLYRSANPRTLARLAEFLPVPAVGITRDFAAGRSAQEICAETIRRLRDAGVERVYVSNLGVKGASERYRGLLDALG